MDVPGYSVAIVQGDQVIYEKRKIEKKIRSR